MRLLHTADWHLGRLFHQLHLTDDQAHVLDQFIDLAKDTQPDVIVIAGDIYDRSVPPPEAVALLDEVLYRLTCECQTKIILIAGNHDSPQRLGFGSRLLAGQGVHVVGQCTAQVTAVPVRDEHGLAYLYALPFAEPAVVREQYNLQDIHDHATAMNGQLDKVRAGHPTGVRAMLIAHAFVAGGVPVEDSERPLSIGGSSLVPADCFTGFDYVALGHLHQPQTLAAGQLRYAGSLLKYSFAEANHKKSVSLVEMDAQGSCRIEPIALTPRHDVRRVSGYIKDLLSTPDTSGSQDDYLEITLLDTDAVFDAMGRLREVYPNVLHIVRPVLDGAGEMNGPVTDHRALEPTDLFASFFEQATGEPITEHHATAFTEVLNELHQVEREVTQL